MLAMIVIVAGAVFMFQGRDEKLLLGIAPIWGLLWLANGIKERNKRLRMEAEIQRLKSRLAGNI
jgi:hypothetical protein